MTAKAMDPDLKDALDMIAHKDPNYIVSVNYGKKGKDTHSVFTITSASPMAAAEMLISIEEGIKKNMGWSDEGFKAFMAFVKSQIHSKEQQHADFDGD